MLSLTFQILKQKIFEIHKRLSILCIFIHEISAAVWNIDVTSFEYLTSNLEIQVSININICSLEESRIAETSSENYAFS